MLVLCTQRYNIFKNNQNNYFCLAILCLKITIFVIPADRTKEELAENIIMMGDTALHKIFYKFFRPLFQSEIFFIFYVVPGIIFWKFFI
jgi:hypothetical protein